jgi:hypothetical protein
MGLNLRDFLFAGTSWSDSVTSGWQQTGDPHNRQITLKELFSGSQDRHSDTIMEAVTANLKGNWLQLTAGVVGIPILVNTVSKLVRKPIILPMNRMLKKSGLDVKV